MGKLMIEFNATIRTTVDTGDGVNSYTLIDGKATSRFNSLLGDEYEADIDRKSIRHINVGTLG